MPDSWLSRDISTVPNSEEKGQPAVRRTNICKDSAGLCGLICIHRMMSKEIMQCIFGFIKPSHLHPVSDMQPPWISLIRPLDPQYPTLHRSWSDGVLPHEIKPPRKAWWCMVDANFECTWMLWYPRTPGFASLQVWLHPPATGVLFHETTYNW